MLINMAYRFYSLNRTYSAYFSESTFIIILDHLMLDLPV